MSKDQEIQSLTNKVNRMETDLEKAEETLTVAKKGNEDGVATKQTAEVLARKIQLLEDELDKAERDVKQATEKLRQVDVKAEHFERQVTRVEQERDSWEKKYEVRI